MVLGAVPLIQEAQQHAAAGAGPSLPALASVTLLNADYELATFLSDTGPRLRSM